MKVFGDPKKFAIEVALEPDPSARFMGNEPLGRILVWVGGHSFGDWEEPSCPFGALTAELGEKGAANYAAWHRNLVPMNPLERFDVLDALIYHADCADRVPTELDHSSIFTNTVECFDGVKAFALTPSNGALQLLISNQKDCVMHSLIDKHQIELIATELAAWVRLSARDA